MTISAKVVKELRERTGAPMMDCKQALTEVDGDLEKAADFLRKKGLKTADKRASRATSEGLVSSYLHHNGLIGVLVEVNCETDFVARNEGFVEFVRDLGQHIAAAKPEYLDAEKVPEDVLAREREIFAAQVTGKPADIVEKIVDGKIKKFYQEKCLVDQPFVKDDSLTIAALVKEQIAKLGENIKIRRFARFDVKE